MIYSIYYQLFYFFLFMEVFMITLPSAFCIWGDSIAKGVIWNESRNRYVICPDSCVKQLSRHATIPVNSRAIMGCTTTQCLDNFDENDLVPGGIAVLEFGGNDCDMPWAEVANAPDKDHIPQTPLPLFQENLKKLIRLTRAGGMKPLLVTPPPIDSERYFHWVSQGLDRNQILSFLGDVHQMYRWQEQYAHAVVETARSEHALLFDLRGAFLKNRRFNQLYCKDGIHPNEEGHAFMTACIDAFIRSHKNSSAYYRPLENCS